MVAGVSLSEESNTADAVAAVTSDLFTRGHLENVAAALCWVTPHHADHIEALVSALRMRLGTTNFAGCVAAGVIATDREVVGSPAIALMVFSDTDVSRYSVNLGLDMKADPAVAVETALGDAGPDDLVFMMAAADSFDSHDFMDALQMTPATVLGGGAGNPTGPDIVFSGQGSHSDATVTLRIANCAPVASLTHACRPISPLLKITGCVGRLLTELGGRPAMEVLREILNPGETRGGLSRTGQLMVGLAPTAAGDQLVRGEYMVRSLVGIAPDNGALLVDDLLRPGMGLVFVTREAEACRSDLSLMMLELEGQIRHAPPKFALVANCIGRGPALHDIPDYEASVIGAYLGGVPTAGFFGSFEFGPLQGPPQLHYYTAVLGLGS